MPQSSLPTKWVYYVWVHQADDCSDEPVYKLPLCPWSIYAGDDGRVEIADDGEKGCDNWIISNHSMDEKSHAQ